ncbi:hypothetical protein [Phosphitispora sp. TUW77]|uniref:hypothetical protein n=1 Tax=Phosphitispora sp. TUW77 TaxID=3152361 RepID=UPI003AB2947B
MHQNKNGTGNGRNHPAGPLKCANCFVCKQDTELCPLNENYDPDAYLRYEARYFERRKEKKKTAKP